MLVTYQAQYLLAIALGIAAGVTRQLKAGTIKDGRKVDADKLPQLGTPSIAEGAVVGRLPQ